MRASQYLPYCKTAKSFNEVSIRNLVISMISNEIFAKASLKFVCFYEDAYVSKIFVDPFFSTIFFFFLQATIQNECNRLITSILTCLCRHSDHKWQLFFSFGIQMILLYIFSFYKNKHVKIILKVLSNVILAIILGNYYNYVGIKK